MNVIDIKVRERAHMTAYLMGASLEMPNLNVRPAVLILPGGGYRYCSDREAEPIALAYLGQGFQAFVLNYTLRGQVPNEEVFPEALADAKEALAYIRAHAKELRVDPNRIAAVGFSAGGNLAAGLSLLTDEKPNALVLGYAVLDDTVQKNLGLTAPVMFDLVDEKTPASFLFTTQGDSVVPPINTLTFAMKLAEHHVPYELHIFSKGEHGQSLGNEVVSAANNGENPELARWPEMSVHFMKALWSGEPLCITRKGRHLEFSAEMRMDMMMSDGRSVGLLEQHFPGLRDKMSSLVIEPGTLFSEFAAEHPEWVSSADYEAFDAALKALN